ncbi:TrfB-related DNA-binding protein [Xylella fastidiosa]|uniref:Transcriptional regulator KorA n=2 Tax=Xylella fastidiosa TaxID=2371 RepID=A0AAW6HY24_XYLFS|nr:TrfB-related DNA-binding protein [Xylella fastidiosa]MDC6409546.1 transcriptional regulator KorA [Xylella fastidiosa subsp. multiplex]
MRVKRRMTAADFEAVRPFLKISDDRIKAARAALVEGQTFQVIGDRFGWSRQAVDHAVRVVWNTLEKYRQSQRAVANTGALLSPGWEQVTLIAPAHLIEKFRVEIAQASQQQECNSKTSRKPSES